MLKELLRVICRLIYFVALFAANTPSQLGFYQKEEPERLKNFLKKSK